MMGAEQVTIPDGIVNGPDRVLPKNSVFKGSRLLWLSNVELYFTENGRITH